jgi:hypothetical protein
MLVTYAVRVLLTEYTLRPHEITRTWLQTLHTVSIITLHLSEHLLRHSQMSFLKFRGNYMYHLYHL